ncbi:MAG TPA: DegT/DnrJ/EryC1/StrS family aminotransferase [Spirochaetota bacterium]|nr:DegT/DnrJ/EryC1/StrS family aminotransferase [Spirochaetota bacterium]HNT11651.1 DegT/DnrJ/EryC1/StrS family aminotransferase [Spirochaetota bacterium]
MEVKYLDLQAQFRDNRELRGLVDGIFSSCQFVLGPALDEFEANFARLCGVNHAIGVDNGTNAIFLALHVLGVGLGDEVITAPNSFLATVGAIAQTGAFPRMVDVGNDYNIDPEQIERAINSKTKAILPVHLTGNPARMDDISAIAKKHGLAIVEDACQSVDAAIGTRKTGSLGDLGAFSLHPLKNLNTCGDGGIITTNSADHYGRLLLLRNHGLKNRNEAKLFAWNFRLDTIKAAVANAQIAGIGGVTDARNRNAEIYDARLTALPHVIIPERRPGVRQAFHTYVIQVQRRDALAEFLLQRGVETKIHYPIPIHLMEAAGVYGYARGDFPNAERQAEHIISLPIHQNLREEQIQYVADTIFDFYGMKR